MRCCRGPVLVAELSTTPAKEADEFSRRGKLPKGIADHPSSLQMQPDSNATNGGSSFSAKRLKNH